MVDTLYFHIKAVLLIMNNPYISVGIDVGADFSYVCIMMPSYELFCKPFKVVHTDLSSMNKAVSTIKKAEVEFQMKSQIFLESTGIFHFPLFCFLRESGFEVSVINPLIIHSTKNMDIRKVKNDKFGLDPTIRKSLIPDEFVLNLRFLCREYYSLSDDRTALINKLSGYVRLVFPAFIGIFSQLAGGASLAVLNYTQSLDHLLSASDDEIIGIIAKAARKGKKYAAEKYIAILDAATVSKTLSMQLPNVFPLIHSIINHISLIDQQMDDILKTINSILDDNHDHVFVRQIQLIDSIPGVGFLSAVTIMCEIGDFKAFKNPKQLFSYFGVDPSVNDSGKFKGSRNHMSKRGSRFARRVLYSIALASIRNKPNSQPMNAVLQAYYQGKVVSKFKKVALGAIMHKVCNIIFAVLRDDSPFVLRSPKEHICLHALSASNAA